MEEEEYEEITGEDSSEELILENTQNWLKTTFKDVIPLEMPAKTYDDDDEEKGGVDDVPPKFNILYSDDYLQGMSIFYAIQQNKEYSNRVLKLTEKLIFEASSFYTLWEYRWKCLMALKDSLQDEWGFCLQVLDLSPKNYQLFNHRRKCFDHLFEPGKIDVTRRELEFCSIAIDRDSKNYHAWSHRWYVLKTTKHESLLKEEISYVVDRIQDDPFNNSAWNQRFSIFHNFHLTNISEEMDFALSQIDRAPSNESVWVYTQGLLRSCNYQDQEVINKVCEKCVGVIQGDGRYVQALKTLGKIAECLDQDNVAGKIYSYLSKMDPIRKNYWLSKNQLMQREE
eukprot:TRINITY_DN17473_c0_g2_i6.p1 TRINITY_DN17473_c0_g2~~TRINITY_DN17473_c0_g2_i6.p1  ORF type:complete len:340 (-),score=57.58 TRINITY_DN17473_c0_g2_i6:99-1118(-)